MNIYNINDETFKQTEIYKNFMSENPGIGRLKIRASLANEAAPVSNVSIIVSKVIGDDKVIFFEGKTDNSGMINNIQLPTPPTVKNDEEVPQSTSYNVEAIYTSGNLDKTYPIAVFDNICMVQYINIVPNTNMEMRDNFGN